MADHLRTSGTAGLGSVSTVMNSGPPYRYDAWQFQSKVELLQCGQQMHLETNRERAQGGWPII